VVGGVVQRLKRLREEGTAGALVGGKRRRSQEMRKFQISDLRFQIRETATANANSRTPRTNTAHGAPADANANADP
jgi:hypothetical protein